MQKNRRLRAEGRGETHLLRTSAYRVERWCDKTMSVLREQQLEACQERLTGCPERGVFDDLCEDEYLALFRFSYYAKELKRRTPGPEALRSLVAARLPQEARFLSPREDALVKRMLTHDGETPLQDWDEISAAEALISRLWCTLQITGEDTAILRLQAPLIAPLTRALQTPDYVRIRAKLFSFDATLHSLLYLSGFLHAAAPLEHFLSVLGEDRTECSDVFISRFLRAGFDYIQLSSGDILLLHPGLAEPERLLATLSSLEAPETHLTQEMVLGGMNGILPEEVASSEAMRGALAGALRPEYDLDEALEDLRMMAKQGARLSEMREVLESMLCVLPTPRMLAALAQLHMQTVRWTGMPSAVLN